MIKLSSIIKQYEHGFKLQYNPLPSHKKALNAMKHCRSSASPQMLVQCTKCDSHGFIPHSCGHRNCPHCQAHESQTWIENQLKGQVPANYFMITFTLPKELRDTAWRNQKIFYNLMFECSKDTIQTFAKNDKSLGGTTGLMSVLHTHARNLDYHPHIHIILPAATLNKKTKTYRTKNGKITYRFQNSKTKKYQTKTVKGECFHHLLMQHVLPKGFRRARNYGFTHPNCKKTLSYCTIF